MTHADDRSQSRKSRLFERICVFNIVFIVGLYLIESFIGERNWLVTILTYAPQHFFGVPAVVLLLISIYKKSLRMIILNVISFALFAVLLMGFNIPAARFFMPSGTPIRVLAYNIHHGSRGVEKIADVIKAANPDIVCLQESNSSGGIPDPVAPLSKLLHGWHLARYNELAIFSRYPIISYQQHNLPDKNLRPMLAAKLRIRDIEIEILNVHFSTAAGPVSLAKRPNSLRAYLNGATRVRSQQAAYIRKFAASIDIPLVIAGDFNTPPRGRIYRHLVSRYPSAFSAAGFGTGETYNSRIPVIRIDHILMGDNILARRAKVIRTRASDHLPLMADLMIQHGGR